MQRSPRRFVPHAILCAVVTLALAAGFGLNAALPLPTGSNDFNSPGFIVRHVWLKFAYLADPFRTELSESQKTERVARYFQLNGMIDAKEQEAGDPTTPKATVAADEAQVTALSRERDGIENSVEVILEGRLTKVIRSSG